MHRRKAFRYKMISPYLRSVQKLKGEYPCSAVLMGRTINSPKQELTKPYQLQPMRPSSHRPLMLDAKLSVVPNTHTSMSLTLMFNKSMFTGVRSVLNLQNSSSTTKLFTKPKVMMKPRATDSTPNPVGDSISEPAGLPKSRSALTLKL